MLLDLMNYVVRHDEELVFAPLTHFYLYLEGVFGLTFLFQTIIYALITQWILMSDKKF